MKDDFVVQRVVPPVDRSVNYRPSTGRAGVDVVSARPTLSTPAAQPANVAATPPAVASSVASDEKPASIPAATRPTQVDGPSTVSAAPAAVAKPTLTRFQKLRKRSLRPTLGVLGAVVILGVTGYVAADTWLTNNVVRKSTPSTSAVAGESTTATEGSDETEVTTTAVNAYKVAADMPRLLTIDKLNVRARVLPMGVTATSAIQAPVNIFDSGWYTGSAKPGSPGISFIDAHASGATRAGLFAYLDTLKAGDTINIEKGDGTVLNYAVKAIEIQNLNDIDMTKVLSPQHGIKEGLTIMTCTGKWMADKETYDQRVIVYTERMQ